MLKGSTTGKRCSLVNQQFNTFSAFNKCYHLDPLPAFYAWFVLEPIMLQDGV
jgi:hypothetical protein